MKAEHIEQTFRKQNKSLLNYIKKHLPLEQAEDVLQDVFIQFFNNYEQIQSFENISSWLYKTAINRVIDLKRKKRPDLFGDKKIRNSENSDEVLFLEDILPALNDGPEENLFRKIIWQEIEEALEELPDE